eukprot:TRINITY_DN9201_c0_g1_i21.p2 TRINITY_DN9201_c0_g1~~TRINITY_DN9201_c0_g1_i21.p2  ORF type:complete len:136 (-),score=26.50 TRINITY_DN9201_c0_g1_i21:159-566(-)
MKSNKGGYEYKHYSKKQHGRLSQNQYRPEPVYSLSAKQHFRPRVKYVKVKPFLGATKDWSSDETKGDSDTQMARMHAQSAEPRAGCAREITISRESLREIISGKSAEIRHCPIIDKKFANLEGLIPLPSFACSEC